MKLKLIEAVTRQLPSELIETDVDEVDKIIKNSDYFPNQNLIKGIETELVQAITTYGKNPDNNPFLRFAMDEENSIKQISPNLSKKLYNAFAQDDIDFDSEIDITKWIFNDNAYNGGEFKLNLFLILSDPDKLRQYGIDKNAFRYIDKDELDENEVSGLGFGRGTLFNLILGSNDNKALTKLTDKFQATYSKNKKQDDETSQTLQGSEDEQKKKLYDYYRARTTTNINDTELQKIINDNYKAKLDISRLKALINKAIDNKLKLEVS